MRQPRTYVPQTVNIIRTLLGALEKDGRYFSTCFAPCKNLFLTFGCFPWTLSQRATSISVSPFMSPITKQSNLAWDWPIGSYR